MLVRSVSVASNADGLPEFDGNTAATVVGMTAAVVDVVVGGAAGPLAPDATEEGANPAGIRGLTPRAASDGGSCRGAPRPAAPTRDFKASASAAGVAGAIAPRVKDDFTAQVRYNDE